MAWRPAPDAHPLFTIDDYLALERIEEERHEYLDGCVYAMAGESPDHGTICMNLSIHLGSQLLGTPCRAFSKDTKVRCGPSPRPGGSLQGLFAYPDLVIVCGTMQFHDQAHDVLLNPTVIVEVLSPSTEAFDRGEVPPLSDLAANAHRLYPGRARPAAGGVLSSARGWPVDPAHAGRSSGPAARAQHWLYGGAGRRV